jgi:hypothetical protein
VDGAGSAYVTGETTSSDFPMQNPFQGVLLAAGDAFVTKVSPSGTSLVYSTYLGGSSVAERGVAIAVDSRAAALVAGTTDSTDFPTLDPWQTDRPFGDVFVTKLSPAGNSLMYSTYLGGDSYDEGWGIAVDTRGNAYVAGWTISTDFPTLNPYQTDQPLGDGFVTKLGAPMDFFALAPCRLIDTRNGPSPYGGPALNAGEERTFSVVGPCLVPLTARAIATNLAVSAPTAAGYLQLYPAGSAPPPTSSINYSPGQTRSNNAIVSLSDTGTLKVRCMQASGTTHVILDVTGYFE